MNVLALNDDVKFIMSKHLASDLKIRTLLSKNHDLQKHYLETSCMTMIFVNILNCSMMLKKMMSMYVYTYVYTYVCMYIRKYVCIYVYMHV
jgi:hypothetical protein